MTHILHTISFLLIEVKVVNHHYRSIEMHAMFMPDTQGLDFTALRLKKESCWTWGPWSDSCSLMNCPTVLCSAPPGASGSQAFNLLQPWICPYHQISSNLKQTCVKGKWLQSVLLIELGWPFCNRRLFLKKKKHQWMSNYSFFFRWEGWRVQSALLHLNGDLEQVVVAFTPAKCSRILRKMKHKWFKYIFFAYSTNTLFYYCS